MNYTKRPTKRYTVAWTREQVVDGHFVPENWIICNAPRPLYGHTTWTGDFIGGIFYAAIDPDCECASRYLHDNAELDAREIVFVTQDECLERTMAYYRAEWPDYVHEIDPLQPNMRRHLVRRGLELMNEEAR